MKVEVLTTLKGNVGEMFYKGDVFTSPHIPQTILEELGANRGLVRVLEEDVEPIVSATPEIPVVVPEAPTVPPVKERSRSRIKR